MIFYLLKYFYLVFNLKVIYLNTDVNYAALTSSGKLHNDKTTSVMPADVLTHGNKCKVMLLHPTQSAIKLRASFKSRLALRQTSPRLPGSTPLRGGGDTRVMPRHAEKRCVYPVFRFVCSWIFSVHKVFLHCVAALRCCRSVS